MADKALLSEIERELSEIRVQAERLVGRLHALARKVCESPLRQSVAIGLDSSDVSSAKPSTAGTERLTIVDAIA